MTGQAFTPFVKGLPDKIVFDTKLLETVLKPGDHIRGSYLNGSIDEQRVRVVSAHVIGED